MGSLIVTTFDNQEQAQQVYHAMLQLRQDVPTPLEVCVVTKGADGTTARIQDGDSESVVTLDLNVSEQLFGNAELISNVVRTLTAGQAALFVTANREVSSIVTLTLMLLYLPQTDGGNLWGNDPVNRHDDAELDDKLDTYQLTVTNLDKLDTNSTDAEVEDAFSAVARAYDALIKATQKPPASEDFRS